MRLLLNTWRYYSPADAVTGESNVRGLLDTIDALSEDPSDDKETKDDLKGDEFTLEDTDDEDVSEDTKTDTLEEEEIKDEDDEKDAEDDALETILSPFDKKKFVAKYPDALKNFPGLEKIINSEVKYREVFTSVNEALEAKDSLEKYQEIESDLETGSSTGFLNALKGKSQDAFAKVVDNYMTNLQEVDKEAYFHVIGNNVKSMVVAMAREAQSRKDNDLLTAAKILNTFTFGSEEFVPAAKFSKEEDPERTKIASEREKFNQERLETYQGELSNKVDSQITKLIDKYIDPKEQMTPYIKKNATREVNEMVAEMIDGDKPFQQLKDRLWDKASKGNFSQASMGDIHRAYVAKAKQLLPHAIKKVRASAISGGSVRRADVDRKGPLEKGGSSAPASNKKFKEVPKGMSTKDFLMQD